MPTIAALGPAPAVPPGRPSRSSPGPADTCYFHPAPGKRLGLDMDVSFKLLRDHARHSNQRLTDVARQFAESAAADFPPPARRSARA